MKIRGLFIIIVFTGLIGSCDDIYYNDESPAGPSYSDIINFDTSGYILAKQTVLGESYTELALTWEHAFGEPFIDNNSNGIYDEGDDFIMSPDSIINQDLDRNSNYTPPDYIPWRTGVPFDDINGDSICNQNISDFSLYLEGQPFCDFNGSDTFDFSTDYFYTMVKCTSLTSINGEVSFLYYRINTPWYRFDSDSDYTYYLPDSVPAPATLYVNGRFILTDSGLVFQTPDITVKILDNSELGSLDSKDITVSVCGYMRTLRKSFKANQPLVIGDKYYNNTLLVQLSPIDMHSDNPAYIFFEFNFSGDLGLIALKYDIDVSSNYIFNYFFDSRLDTIPQPMTK